ncbi:hypothetical protein [Bosea sp. (in: a-proteobacteria)]
MTGMLRMAGSGSRDDLCAAMTGLVRRFSARVLMMVVMVVMGVR